MEGGAVETRTEPEALFSDVPTEQHEQSSEHLPTKEKQIEAEPEDAQPQDVTPISAKLGNTGTDDAESIEERCRKTDITVFKFYFRFINLRRATIFIVFQTCLAFLSSFPGKRRYYWWPLSPVKRDFLTFYSHLAQVVDGREPRLQRQQDIILHRGVRSPTGCCTCCFSLGDLVSKIQQPEK